MALLRSLLGGLIGGILANNPALVSFGLGVIVGIYTDQSYKVPKLEETLHKYVDKVKEWEKGFRK